MVDEYKVVFVVRMSVYFLKYNDNNGVFIDAKPILKQLKVLPIVFIKKAP